MPTLDWQMRPMLHEFRESGRLNVLVALILHSNIRLRCWVGTELLIKETGYESKAVVAAKQWLIKRGALSLVSYKYRVDEERKLPSRQHVMQLTGVIMDEKGEWHRYLHISPETEEAVKVVPSEISLSKTLLSTTKGSSISKGDSKKDIAPAKADAPASKPKAKREPDPMFDAMCIELFEINPRLVPPDDQSNVGSVYSWLAGRSTGTKTNRVGKNEIPAKAEDMKPFREWYKRDTKGATMPTHVGSVATWWRKYVTQRRAAPPVPVVIEQPASAITFHDVNDFLRFDANGMYVGEGAE
jgi:hypothetical protein